MTPVFLRVALLSAVLCLGFPLASTAQTGPVAVAKQAIPADIAPAAEGGPALIVTVSKTRQEMTVIRDGAVFSVWPVSTARPGKVTPTGEWTPQALVRFHRSTIYNNAPMPWSIFYNGNYAIHGTVETGKLGRPASAGCIRLHPDNAKVLWEMVREIGRDRTRVIVTD
jgi:lipoprotein-anchoring transpeptidase ErfK/SrfK